MFANLCFKKIKTLKIPTAGKKTSFRKALFSKSFSFLVMIVKASTATMVNKRECYLENRSILKIMMPHTNAPNMVEK